jgi:hypothetical protein
MNQLADITRLCFDSSCFPSLGTGPLLTAPSSGKAGDEATFSAVQQLISQRIDSPVHCALSDRYFACRGPVAADVSKRTSTSSEKFMWMLLRLLVDTNGQV